MTDPENDLRRNLATGQFYQMSRMETALMAKELGLDPAEYAQPFPGNHTITVNHAPPAVPKSAGVGIGKLAAVALGAAGLTAVGVLGWPAAATWLATKATERVVEKVITQPGQDYDVKVRMQVIPPNE
jgi:hypothetical protein